MTNYESSREVPAASRDLADKAIDAGVRVAGSIDRTVSRVQDAGEQLAAQGAKLGDNLQTVAKNFSGAIDKSVSNQPMTTLGLAVAAGFVLGALWKA